MCNNYAAPIFVAWLKDALDFMGTHHFCGISIPYEILSIYRLKPFLFTALLPIFSVCRCFVLLLTDVCALFCI